VADMSVDQEYNASPDTLWKLIREFGNLDWMPGVASCQSEGEGIGALRHITMGDNVVTERLEAFDDVARSLSYSIQKGPVPVQDYLATMTVSETDGGCRVDWSARFKLPDGIPAEAVTQGLAAAYGGTLKALKKQLDG